MTVESVGTANGLTAADDGFHAVAEDDPLWTETSWFGFAVPERGLTGAVYPLFRTAQGVASVGVYVWDASATAAHQITYARTDWHVPIGDARLEDLRLADGLRIRCVSPLATYEIEYEDGDELELRLRFDALHAPYAPLVGSRGHFDQAGRVTGRLVLRGEELTVDCHEMRDRSWGVRRDRGMVRAGYTYAVSADRAFLAVTMPMGDTDMVVTGYHWADGKLARLSSGTRRVERHAPGGPPATVTVDAVDENGRAVRADGRCESCFAFQSSPNYFAWMSGTAWRWDGADARGEDQDVWSPDLLRAASR